MTWTEINDGIDDRWPVASLDPIARLRVLAAGLPGTVLEERVLDAPFDDVWDAVSDLERSVPAFDEGVASLRVLSRDGTTLRARTGGTWRGGFLPLGFDIDLEPGWCWMVSRPRFYVVGMAAVPDGRRTRWGHLEGFTARIRPLRPLLRTSRLRHRRHVRSDVDGIERFLGIRR